MSENLDIQKEPSSSHQPSDEEIRRCLEAEILEMEKYKWCLGIHLQHDPLQDRSLNDIYCEWIDKYASDFRKDWEKRKPGKSPNN
ncbi:MAG: hypothetical protein JXA71_05720 [Chitinispirillaceae bacterium]|nr:hypothetical protein [Chitinispirillaceae bacterium]